ncbi:MAG: chemosensory pili system protein ChpA (sensor histidine kinase/response regulator) [Gammaproteobacteria bacterium]|jgi:chemosensory pili system protein ChpA (sensor histidine kinase/response regulator)
MNLQESSIKQSALGWVKKSIDDYLSEIKTNLKLYIEEGDENLLENVNDRLSLIQGVLMMIEQYGAAMLTEEMLSLGQYILDKQNDNSNQALEVLLRAVLQLPDYLEHIQSGHKDIPIAILPLLNDIRTVKNQDLFSEKLLFLPDLSMHKQAADLETIDDRKNHASKLLAKKLRPVYQISLLNVIKDQKIEESLRKLEKVCDVLEERSASEQIARIWWIIGALIESLKRQQLELGVSIKSLLGKVDALFRVLLIIGEKGLLQRQPVDLIKNFLYYLAQPECDGPKTKAIKTAYRLEQFLPSEAARSKVLSNIAGPNQALLKTVAEAVKADIETVKSTLEVYVNGDPANISLIKDLPHELHIISDTLAMIGFGQQRQLIEGQIGVVKKIISSEISADEEQLLLMAEELIQVEQSLDLMQFRIPVVAEESRDESTMSRDFEFGNVISAVVSAALDNIQKTKSAILEFVKDTSRYDNIELCNVMLNEARGALILMNHDRAVSVIDGLMLYLKDYDPDTFIEAASLDSLSQVVVSLEYYLEAVGEHRGDVDDILGFANIQLQGLLSGVKIEEFTPLEPEEELVISGEDQSKVDVESELDISIDLPSIKTVDESIDLDLIDRGVNVLSDPSDELSDDEVGVSSQQVGTGSEIEEEPDHAKVLIDVPGFALPETDQEIVHELSGELEDLHAVLEIDESGQVPSLSEIEQTDSQYEDRQWIAEAKDTGARHVVPVVEELEILKEGSDPEILEIYLEEAEEESINIARMQQDWLMHPEDENALRNIRRAFHTIKGSGRLVGASKIGEFAWDYEQLLNRVIDKTVITDSELIGAVGLASGAMFELVEELKSRKPPGCDIAWLRGLARSLSEFRADKVLSEHTMTLQRTETDDDRITDEPLDPARLVDIDDDDFATPIDSSDRVNPNTQGISEHDPESAVAAVQEEAFQSVTDDPVEEIELTGLPGMEQVSDSPMDAIAQLAHNLRDPERIEVEDSIELGSESLMDLEASLIIPRSELGPIEQDYDLDDEAENEAANFPDEPGIDSFDVDDSLAFEEAEAIAISNPDHEEILISVDEALRPEKIDVGFDGDPPTAPLADLTGTVKGGEKIEAVPRLNQGLTEPTDLSFDPELLTIYQQEVEQHLSIVNSVLKNAEQSGELVPGEDIYRALHTIHGASRTADIGSIGELSGLMEKPLKSAIAQRMALDLEIVALYQQGHDALKKMTAELVETRRLPSIDNDLKISFWALAEDFEEHTVEIPGDSELPTGEFIDTLTMMNEMAGLPKEQDDELLTIFIDEANELLEMSDHTLDSWSKLEADESGNYDFSAVMELQRYLHTLKGGARMAELNEISDLSHEMESLFIAVIDGRVDKSEDLVDVIRGSFDLLQQQVVEAEKSEPLSSPESQLKLIHQMRFGEDDDHSTGDGMPNDQLDSEDIDIVAENFTGEVRSQTDRPGADVIKVRSDLLDNLVNSAGEVSIYRARMEQQITGLGSYLGELGQTINRLKNQLRNLEAETDTQIHFSHKTQDKNHEEFDPLELDRYTVIQELSRSLSESVNDLSSLQNMLGDQVKDSETLLLQQSRVNTDLQDGLIKSRMVRFSGLLSRLRRLVRQSSQEVGRKAELIVSGENNEVDNKVLDRMIAPLEHIIRNAISHGIETPVERVKKGKPETGIISIEIQREGSDIVIKVSDDGSGINTDKIRSRALQLGLINENQAVTDAELVQYILEPGFSTAEHVTQLSGRGVGMDVVSIEIKQLGGTLQIDTNPQGTAFIARLPFTLSINQAIMVRTGEELYAIPLINIEGITRLDTSQLLDYYSQDSPKIEYTGQSYALHHLGKLVEASEISKPDEATKQSVILGRAGDTRVALHVDEILGNREIVVKPLGKQLSQVKSLAGASILADGSVVLILDIGGIIRHSVSNPVKIVYSSEVPKVAETQRSKVMVVDDSITMRRVASKLLERHDYDVVTAKDGVDALAQLEDTRPDVMLLDVEMPRMDGFELATYMRNEASYSNIPIIMITSRTGEKHRDRAFEIGVTNYMGKPYQEDELISNIQSALSNRK